MYPYKIAVIDDNQAVLKSLKLVLKRVFVSVVTLPNPNSLPSLLESEEIDVILLDMNFNAQRLDGEEGISWLKYIKQQPNPPAVVLITAFGDIGLAVQSLKEGAEDFVSKPWDNDELVEKLLAAIEKRETRQRLDSTLREARQLKARWETTRQMTLYEVENRHILEVLNECGGNLAEAAVRLNISRQTLYNRLKKYGIMI
ncbi:MAG: DNA-binding response regulator [Bacteroidaceae bacterium]|nr:DNA-binding response regulator [Bacteroidaceae bacterium]